MKEELKNKIDLNSGLTSNEVNQRIKEEKVNYNNQPVTKSISEIIKSNVLTYFNFLNIFLCGAVIFAGIISNQLMYSLKNCLFQASMQHHLEKAGGERLLCHSRGADYHRTTVPAPEDLPVVRNLFHDLSMHR